MDAVAPRLAALTRLDLDQTVFAEDGEDLPVESPPRDASTSPPPTDANN